MQSDRETGYTPPGGPGQMGGGRDIPTPAGGGERGTVERAREAASEVGHKAAEQIESRVEQRKHRVAESLEDVAESLRSASDRMPAEDGIGRYIHRAADQVEHLASFLDEHEIAEFIDDVEGFARRQPAVFVGGAFALGMLGARFLKSSRRDLAEEGVRERYGAEDLTGRVEDPTRDAVSRPMAPGYVPPEQRRPGGFGEPPGGRM